MGKPLLLLAIGGAVAAAFVLLLLGAPSTLDATHAMPCADLDGNGVVTQIDIDIVVSYYGQDVPPAPPQADMTADGRIRLDDIFYVAGQYGNITDCQDKPIGLKGVVPHQGRIFPAAGGSVGDTLPAASAALSSPAAVAVVDKGGSQVNVYIADSGHCRVRKVSADGTTSTVAGTGECGFGGDGGPAVDAKLDSPTGVAFDASGNMYIADESNCRVRMVDTSGDIDTIAGSDPGGGPCGFAGDGGAATSAQLDGPYDVLVSGSELFIVDRNNCRVRMVDTSGDIDTIAGNDPGGGPCGFDGDGGAATSAQLDDPRRLALDGDGNLFISDGGNCRVRMVDTSGDIDTIAGNDPGGGPCGFAGDSGEATSAQLDEPDGLVEDGAGNLYISDLGNCRVRMVDTSGDIDTIAGNDPGGGPCGYAGDGGPPASAQLDGPAGLALDGSGRLYIADRDNHRVRRIASPISTFAGTGLPDFCGDGFVAITDSCLGSPHDVSVDDDGNVYIADSDNHRVRWINASDGHIDTLAGKTEQTDCAGDNDDADDLCLARPQHIVVSPDNGLLYVSDRDGNRVWRVNLSSGLVYRVAGAAGGDAGLCVDDTSSQGACLDEPRGLALQQESGTDRYLFIAEEGNAGRVMRVDLSDNTIRTVVNDNEVSADVALGPDGSLYIAEQEAHRVRRMDTGGDGLVDGDEGSPVTVAGTGTADLTSSDATVATLAQLDNPVGVEVDDGDHPGHLLISDRNNHRLWVVTQGVGTPKIVDGEVSELIYRIAGGGSPTPGFCGDPKPKPSPAPANTHNARDACLHTPAGLFYDEENLALYFADELNNRVRKVPSDCDIDGLTDKAEIEANPYVTDPCDTDTDDDGCTDAQELGPEATRGGQRDPTWQWDYFNPTKDGVNRSDDILDVVENYRQDANLPSGPPDPGYSTDRDRGPLVGPNDWDFGAPDGVIRSFDIWATLVSYRHDCGPYG